MAQATGVSQLPGLAERRAALEERFAPWRARTLAAAFDELSREHPDRSFLTADDRTLTYAEVGEWSRRIARGLVHRGIAAGEHVAMILPNGAAFVAVRLAIARVRAVAVPINFLLRDQELAYVLEQSQAAALITMEEFRGIGELAALDRIVSGWDRRHGGAPSAGSALPSLRLVVTVPREATDRSRRDGVLAVAGLELASTPELDQELEQRVASGRPQDVTTIFYTSGTTGRPKGVLSDP